MAKVTVKSKATTKTKGKRKDDTRSKIKSLIEQIEKTWVDISILLADVYEKEKYKEWGFEKFEDYTQEELNLEYRSAMYRVQLGKAINELGLDKERIKNVGWTKIKEILPLLREEVDEKTIDALLDHASKKSVRALKDFVKRAKEEVIAGDNIETVKKVKVTFQFIQDQWDIVSQALDRAMELANTDNKALALEYICGEWLESDNPNLPEANEEVEDGIDEEIEIE